jgi:hypothetical protein
MQTATEIRTMSEADDYIRHFFKQMGVTAEIRVDETDQKLIVIPLAHFLRQQPWIEAWFTLVKQDGDNCYLRERLRGTGQTK